jgi:hypothetical protein
MRDLERSRIAREMYTFYTMLVVQIIRLVPGSEGGSRTLTRHSARRIKPSRMQGGGQAGTRDECLF